MQKITAILFLLFFSVLQYGKLISYWNCKITNTGNARDVQCDCEKILTLTNGDEDAHLQARAQIIDKAAEWNHSDASVVVPENSCTIRLNKFSRIFFSSSAGYTKAFFEPPKLS